MTKPGKGPWFRVLPVKRKVLGPAGAEGDWKEAKLSRMAAKGEVRLVVCAVVKVGVGMLKLWMGLFWGMGVLA